MYLCKCTPFWAVYIDNFGHFFPGRVVTQRDVTAPSLFGSWQLIARTTHISVARGPTTMEIMMGKDGNARFAMARHAV